MTVPAQPLRQGSPALLRGQPFIPPVRITLVHPLPWGGTRFYWRHEAPGFGRSPQQDDGPCRLIPVPAEYVAPPAGGDPRALGAWLFENSEWLVPTFGAASVARAPRAAYERRAVASVWAGIAQEIIAERAGRAALAQVEIRRAAA
jgi:hypothetical protein